ncbi:Lateral signaling target protein 2 [Nymphon striatum]|nr:Lateral signaling target protein 2 [Nymphon striatum]
MLPAVGKSGSYAVGRHVNLSSFNHWSVLYNVEKGDTSILAQFYYADEELNFVASELDSFDGRKDPERCTALVSKLRKCQDKVLNICNKVMDEAIPEQRIGHEFRAKFPDEVFTETLAGELWFGAECLAAGSTIVNREVESASLRPLAKAVTRSLDQTKEALKVFDKLFADFELSYVSVLVPVKSAKEFRMQQDVTVLMSETLHRALKVGLITQEMVDNCDPILMFTIPRLAIVYGLLYYPHGALNIDVHSSDLSELFRPFQSLLHKIRDLIRTLSKHELYLLEKYLYSLEEPIQREHQELNTLNSEPEAEKFINKFYQSNNNCKQFITDFYSYNFGTSPAACALSQQNANDQATPISTECITDMNSSPSNLVFQQLKVCDISENVDISNSQSSQLQQNQVSCNTHDININEDNFYTTDNFTGGNNGLQSSESSSYTSVSMLNSSPGANQDCVICNDRRQLQRSYSESSASASSYNESYHSPRRLSEPALPNRTRQRHNSISVRNRVYGLPLEFPLSNEISHRTEAAAISFSTASIDSGSNDLEVASDVSSCGTSSVHSDCQDDEEIALAIQAAEIASHREVRSRFTTSRDLIHRLFVCISGVADQLQTNYASDLRNILKCVFDMNSSEIANQIEVNQDVPSALSTSISNNSVDLEFGSHSLSNNDLNHDEIVSNDDGSVENGEDALEEMEKLSEMQDCTDSIITSSKPPVWVPDDESSICMDCSASFTILRRRHHCRNCGKVIDSDNSDVDYEPMESDNETIDSYESDDVDLSEHEDDGVMLSDSWKRISDIFSDCRPNSLPELVRNFSGVNPALNCNANNSVLDCFKKFITNDVIVLVVLSCDRIARSAGATPLVLKGLNC